MTMAKRKGILLVAFVAVSLLLTACRAKVTPTAGLDVGPGVAYEIRSIEEISAGGPPEIVDIAAHDAVLVFESSVPLACSAS